MSTTDHDEIRRWVEERRGHPATVRRTGGKSHAPGILRIDYPGYSGNESLEEISWDDFFEKFEKEKLAFLYQDETGGDCSRFSKIIARKRAVGGADFEARALDVACFKANQENRESIGLRYTSADADSTPS